MLFPISYLPCELKGRDFKSRLLIAAHILKAGYPVIVGQHWSIVENAPAGPQGCFLFKTANHIQVLYMNTVRSAGHVIVASDEEALSTSETYVATQTDPKVFNRCAAYLAVSEAHRRALLHSYPDQAERLMVVGTARADLLRLTPYRRPHPKPYALVNTSFGICNSTYGQDGGIKLLAKAMNWDQENPEHARILDSRVDYERAALTETEKVIKWLIGKSGLDVVIRPHPSERADRWQEIEGAHVVTNSDPYPWLRFAKVMIHNDSTLGIEAAIMGAPALNLSPRDAWVALQNVRDYNLTAGSAEEAITLIKSGAAAKKASNARFPSNAARATAKIMTSFLPPPVALPAFQWHRRHRHPIEVDKFTVSPDECAAAIREVFPLAKSKAPRVTMLDDSVFFLEPS